MSQANYTDNTFTLIDNAAGDALRAVHTSVANLQIAVDDLSIVNPCRLIGDRMAIASAVVSLLLVSSRIGDVVIVEDRV